MTGTLLQKYYENVTVGKHTNLVSIAVVPFSLNRIPVMAPILAPILGVHFFGGIFPSKMGRFSPFLATIQAHLKTCVFLFNKRSEGCFVSDAPPLVLAPTIFIIALFSVEFQLGIDSGSC
jgi:hypothetical protein